MNFKALSLGAMVGFLVALSPSCGTNTAECNASNCAGCCDATTGVCLANNLQSEKACGASGNECKACGTGESCEAGECKVAPAADSGTGCNATTCPTGCCSGTVCLLGSSTSNCGTGGAACETCSTGQTCTNKVCTGTDGGVSPGTLGAACAQDIECTGVGGNPPRCKLTTSQGNLTYKDGYCTRRCLQDSECGDDGMCIYGLGPVGEAENICVKKCDATNACRDGYVCLNFGTNVDPAAACWIDDTASDEPYATLDAGAPAADGLTGSACTDNVDCQPPEGGACFTADRGFPGGACTADCSLALVNSFCGDGGVCTLYASALVEGQDPFVIGLCEQACNPDGSGTPCREGYLCEKRGAPDAGRGACQPRCDIDGGITCQQGATCVDGLCQ